MSRGLARDRGTVAQAGASHLRAVISDTFRVPPICVLFLRSTPHQAGPS